MWRDRGVGAISKKWLGAWVEEAAEEATETKQKGHNNEQETTEGSWTT